MRGLERGEWELECGCELDRWVPTADDVVTINPAGTLTITIDAGAQVAASVSLPGG